LQFQAAVVPTWKIFAPRLQESEFKRELLKPVVKLENTLLRLGDQLCPNHGGRHVCWVRVDGSFFFFTR